MQDKVARMDRPGAGQGFFVVFFKDHCNRLYFRSHNKGLVKGFKQEKQDRLTF